jgi:putative flippase GtrA
MNRLATVLTRQILVFLLVGAAQLALDSSVFILSTALGASVVPGKLLGRVSGAVLGYWLNGRYTFADNGVARLSGRHLRRFVIAWLCLTAISAALLYAIASRAGLHAAWWANPLVEAFLAAIGFVVWRQWVYR